MRTRHTVWFRSQVERNTDPQRRCYNGCHFSSVMEWTAWGEICTYSTKERAADSAATFQSINPAREYAVLPEGTNP